MQVDESIKKEGKKEGKSERTNEPTECKDKQGVSSNIYSCDDQCRIFRSAAAAAAVSRMKRNAKHSNIYQSVPFLSLSTFFHFLY